MTAPVLLGLLAAVLAGVVLVFLGVRGKRLNRNPTCRDCRFDLSGMAAGTITCPECGAGLKRANAIRIGQRRRRPLFIAGGGVLAGFPLLLVGTAAFAMMTGSEVDSYKPLWLLTWEAGYVSAPRSQSIAKELNRRVGAKALSPEQRAGVVALALEIQGDTRRAWWPEWGDLIEDARMDGVLSEEDKNRFKRQAAVLEWKARPKARAGGVLPVVATLKEARVGSTTMMHASVSLKAATIDGEKARRVWPQQGPFGMQGAIQAQIPDGMPIGWLQLAGAKSPWGVGGMESIVQSPLKVPADAASGPHEAAVVLHVQAMDINAGTVMNWPNMSAKKPAPPDVGEHAGRLRFEVLPADVPAVELVEPTPELTEKLRKAVEPTSIQVWPQNMGGMMMVQFSLSDLPVDVAFDVHVKSGEKTWKLGTLTSGEGGDDAMSRAGGADGQRTIAGETRGVKGQSTVTLVMKPSVGAAERTLDLTRIYNGELVFESVEVGAVNFNGGAAPATTGSTLLDLIFGK